MHRPALVLAAAITALLAPAPAAAVTGDVRLLVVLATWGPQPVTEPEAHAAVAETAAYVQSASFGRVRLQGEVTPWLRAYSAPIRLCDLAALEAGSRSAAAAAGWNVAGFDQLAFVFPRVDGCPWSGAYFENDVWANGRIDRHLLAHELGHVWGVTEEGPAWSCSGGRCNVENYASPYSVMGHGLADYNAFEKATYGWLEGVASLRRAGRYELAPIDRPSSLPQALRVVTAADDYWLEYRAADARWPAGDPTAAAGLVVHAGGNGLGSPSRFPQRNLLLADPAGRGRPSVQAGETFAVTGAFSASVERVTAASLELSFRFTDRTPPARPTVVAPKRTVGRAAVARWSAAADRGSGVDRYEVSVDGRTRRLVPAVTAAGTAHVLNERRAPLGRLTPGAHTVAVVAVDRAGNRSRAGVRRFRVQR